MEMLNFILEVAYFFIVQFFSMASGFAGLICIFTAGYTYANIVRYRAEHDGELDLVEVLHQMSPKSKKDDDDLEVEYISEENQNDEIEIVGETIEIV